MSIEDRLILFIALQYQSTLTYIRFSLLLTGGGIVPVLHSVSVGLGGEPEVFQLLQFASGYRLSLWVVAGEQCSWHCGWSLVSSVVGLQTLLCTGELKIAWQLFLLFFISISSIYSGTTYRPLHITHYTSSYLPVFIVVLV